MKSHSVQYKIIGDFTQILEVNLPPEKTIITDATFLLYFDEEVALQQRNTDGADEVEEEIEEELEGDEEGRLEGELEGDEFGETPESFEDEFGEADPFAADDPELEGLDDSIMGDLDEGEEELPETEFESEEEVDPSKGNLLGKLWTATRKKVQSIKLGSGGNQDDEEENDGEFTPDGEGGLPEGFDPESIGGELDGIDEEGLPDFDEEMTEPEPEPEPVPERIFTHLSNQSEFIRKVALAPAQPCHVLDINLGELEDKVVHICKGSFIAAAKGTEVSTFAETDILLRPHHDEGLVIEKLEGDGMVFLKAKGDVVERILEDDAIRVNLASVVAFEPSIELDMDSIQSLESLQDADPVILVLFSGSGMLWLQSNQMTPHVIQHITQQVEPASVTETAPELPPVAMFDANEPDESPELELPNMGDELPPLDGMDDDMPPMPDFGEGDPPEGETLDVPPANDKKAEEKPEAKNDDDDDDLLPPEIRALTDGED
ncbi:AIM24 family protein [uncultured Microscilla sp.]|uniref:AIM24 family protein n=1 Tax=uncultured Microscilla sp. TaxID=432653 RepID=UPI00262B0149|nr:AIM24 family protein [uncultured Microscilla sp.]